MTGFSQLAGLPELVRDSQLPATFRWEGQQQFTIHAQGASRRAKQSQEVWAHMGMLGQGGFGSVELQAKQTKSKSPGEAKELRAVKSIRISEEELKDNLEFYVRELEAIVKFSQARYGDLFVKSYGWFACQSVLYIAMEYCELGDLQKYLLKNCQERRLPENQAHDIASQVLDALARMHEEKFAHRDLKPANILIKSHPPAHPWMVKVADFGISRRDQGTTMNATTSVRGTSSFMPPELLGFSSENSRAVNLYAVDMWCYGETLFRILTGDGTFKKPADLYGYYFGHVKFPSSVLEDIQLSSEVINFLQSLLTCDPTQRLTAEMALDHQWMETDFHGSDASSRRSSRLMPSPKLLESVVAPNLEHTIMQMTQTENTEASASWTENFSQMHLEDELTFSQASTSQQKAVNSSNFDSRTSFPRASGSGQSTLLNISRGEDNSSKSIDRPSKNLSFLASALSVPEHMNSAPYSQSSVSPKYAQDGAMSGQDGLVEEDTAASLSWTSALPIVQTSKSIHSVTSTDQPPSQPTQASLTSMASASWNPEGHIPPPDGMNHFGGHHAAEETETTLVTDRINSETDFEAKSTGEFDKMLDSRPQYSTNSPGRENLGATDIFQNSQKLAIPHSKQAKNTSPQYGVGSSEGRMGDERLDQAEAFFKNGDFMSAKDQYQKHWESAKSILGGNHPRTIHALDGLVESLIRLQEYTTAEILCRELVALRISAMVPDHVDTLSSRKTLAFCLAQNGNFNEAITQYEDIIRSCRRKGYTTALYGYLEDLVYVYLSAGKSEAAESIFQDHIKTKGNVLGHTHELVLESVYKFATLLNSKYGNPGAASREAQRFFQLADALERSGEPLTKMTRARLKDLRLISAASQDMTNSNNRPIRLKPSPQYYENTLSYENKDPIRVKQSPQYFPQHGEGGGSQGHEEGSTQKKEKKGKLSRLRSLLSE